MKIKKLNRRAASQATQILILAGGGILGGAWLVAQPWGVEVFVVLWGAAIWCAIYGLVCDQRDRPSARTGKPAEAPAPAAAPEPELDLDVVSCLENLGYETMHAREAALFVPRHIKDFDGKLRNALAQLDPRAPKA